MRYRVLGPVSAYLGGRPRKLGGKRQRIVLAILLSRPNTVISQDSLIDAVWAGEPPQAAKQTLHTYVSTLRKALEGGIERNGEGYVVPVGDDQLDSIQFEAIVARARTLIGTAPQEATDLLSESLSLWHGRAFGDLGGEPALVHEAIRLDEARLTAIEYRIEADLNCGNHLTVIQELEALTREHPFRERLVGFLMLALYRAGRQADALRTYRRASQLLADELGIDPSSDLQDLEDRILNQDATLDWTGETSQTHRRAARGYELREEVQRNRYGVVHRAFQGSVGREVAVLVLDQALANDPELVRRFESELQAVSRLEHPHILPMHDFWRGPDGAYLVNTYLRGGTLEDAIAAETWNLSATLRLVDQIGSAIDYAHRSGYAHGHLSAQSVGLDEDGNAYITDFGLARLGSSTAPPTPQADTHALAMLAHFALTGTWGDTTHPISAKRSDLAVLDPVFHRGLHRDETTRYQRPDDLRRAMRQAAGADVVPAPAEAPSQSRRNPYKGLRAFQEADASDFHGRDALIEELVEILADRRLLAVVGPSGSGKSSLVRAGLLPAIRAGAITGSASWLTTDMFPGTHPMEELEAALLRVAAERPPSLVSELTSDTRGLVRIAKELLAGDEAQLVLIVDQFEELFSLTASEADRKLFLDSLVEAANDERSAIKVVLTMRADFFDQPLEYPDFAAVLKEGLVPIAPPTDDGLARAIAQPARDVGVDLEPGLVTRIVDDVRNEPGGLPLMQYALTELFAGREHNTLTLTAYEATGGVVGALGRRAEEIYKSLPDEGRHATQQLFLRLVTVDELADDTRRRIRQTELRGLGIDQSILDDVIGQYGAYRLLSFDRDAATRTPTIEVAHEALIREWPRLRTWIDDRREDLLTHRRIQVTSHDWEDSQKDISYLLRGARLEQALEWQERTDIAISEDEMTFIEASIEQEKREQAERQALEDRANRRRKAVIGVLAGGLAVAGILGAIAMDRAESERITAAQATARELSAAAIDAIEQDPELGILLALEAFDATDELGLEPVPESASALRDTLRHNRVTLRLPDSFAVVAYSPDGGTLISDTSKSGVMRLFDSETGDLKREVDVLDPAWEGTPDNDEIAFSSDGQTIAVAWVDHPQFPLRTSASAQEGPVTMVGVSLHAFPTFEVQNYLPGPRGAYGKPSFGRGGLIASPYIDISNGGHAIVWDSTSGDVVAHFGGDVQITGAGFIPGTDTLVLTQLGQGSGENASTDQIVAIRITDERELWSMPLTESFEPGEPSFLELSPDGSKAAVGYRDLDLFELVDLNERASLGTFPNADPQTFSWDPSGSRIVVSGNTADIAVHEESAGWEQMMNISGASGPVFGLDVSPDGRSIAAASSGGGGLVWDATVEGAVGDVAVNVGGNVGLIFTGPDPNRLIVGALGYGPRLLTLDPLALETIGLDGHFQFKPDTQLTSVAGFVMEDQEQHGIVVDLEAGTEWRPDPPCLLPMAVSTDSELVVLDAVASCGDGVDVSSGLLDVTTGELLVDLESRTLFKAFMSPEPSDGQTYFVANVGNQDIEIWFVDGSGRLATYSAEDLGVAAFLTLDISPNGRFLAIGPAHSHAIVIDVDRLIAGESKDDAVVFNQEVSKDNVPQVRVTNEGIMASIGFDGIYRVWDLDSGA
ncbi:MAG: hypothetical protein DWQ40_07995, partial [Actinobacteria bacterium]